MSEEALPAAVIERAKELKDLLETQYEGGSLEEKQSILLGVYDEVTSNLEVLPENILQIYETISKKIGGVERGVAKDMDSVYGKLLIMTEQVSQAEPILEPPEIEPLPSVPTPPPARGGKRSAISKKFDKCVKSVRKTVKARKGSNKESAAIAICTTSVLYPRKRTTKRYRKGRLVTQRRKAL
jgi:hypothetical protein